MGKKLSDMWAYTFILSPPTYDEYSIGNVLGTADLLREVNVYYALRPIVLIHV